MANNRNHNLLPLTCNRFSSANHYSYYKLSLVKKNKKTKENLLQVHAIVNNVICHSKTTQTKNKL